MKIKLFVFGFLAIGTSIASAYKLGADGILLNDDGTARVMSQYEALKSCPSGMHLPTARELAIESQSYGALGLLELDQTPLAAYRKVTATNSDGTKDEFYFAYDGYSPTDNNLKKNWFWSSSVFSGDETVAYGLVSWGSIEYFGPRENPWGAVQCFKNP